MALEKQLISMPVGKMAMDAGSDPKTVAGLLRVENARWDLDGAISKRFGSVRLATSRAVPVGPALLGTIQDRALLYNTGSAGVSIEADDSSVTLSGQRPIVADVEETGLPHSRRDAYMYLDCLRDTVVTVLCYTVKSGSTYQVIVDTFDTDTGALLASSALGSAHATICFGRAVKVSGSTNSAICYYFIDRTGALYGGTINATTGAIGAAVAYASASAASTTNREWDCCSIEQGASGYVGIVYQAAASVGRVCLLILDGGADAGGALVDIDDVGGTVHYPSIWRQSASQFGLAWVIDTGAYDWLLKGAIYTYAGAATLGITQIDSQLKATFGTIHSTSGVATSATGSTAYWSLVASSVPTTRSATFTTGGAGAAASFAVRARLAAKPAAGTIASGSTHIVCLLSKSWGYALGAQDTLFFVDDAQGGTKPFARALPGRVRLADAYGQLPQLAGTVSAGLTTAAPWLLIADNSIDNKNVYQCGRLTLRIDAASIGPSRSWAIGRRRCIIPGSCSYDVDGSSVVEHGFHLYPEPFAMTGTVSGPGVGAMAGGTYYYKLVYEQIDAHGSRHQSSPSPEYGTIAIAGAGTGGSDSVTLTCPCLPFTAKSNVQIAVYRSTVNSLAEFYRVGTVANDTTAATVTFLDTYPDAWIVDQEELYVDDGTVENVPPRPHRIACVAGGRYIYADRWAEATDIYYSKPISDPMPVECADLMRVKCDPAGGSITAIHALLDKVVVFKTASIYAFETDGGYDAALGGSNFATPWLVNPSIGCANQNCVALTPLGLVFLGGDGDLWLLDHSLQCKPFSGPVHYWTSTLTPVALVCEPDQSLLHVMTDGYDLVYDWSHDRWSIWSARACTAAIEINGDAWWLGTDGGNYYVWKNDQTVYTDNAARAALTIETGWLTPAQLGGMLRLYETRIVGQNIAAHSLRVKFGYDQDPNWLPHELFSSSALPTFDSSAFHGAGLAATYEGAAYALRAFPSRPTCSSFRMHLSDEAGTGNTWSLTALDFLVGLKRGAQRVHAGRVL